MLLITCTIALATSYSVPRETETVVKRDEAYDIPESAQQLKLAEQIGRGVRSGTLPLKLQIGER